MLSPELTYVNMDTMWITLGSVENENEKASGLPDQMRRGTPELQPLTHQTQATVLLSASARSRDAALGTPVCHSNTRKAKEHAPTLRVLKYWNRGPQHALLLCIRPYFGWSVKPRQGRHKLAQRGSGGNAKTQVR